MSTLRKMSQRYQNHKLGTLFPPEHATREHSTSYRPWHTPVRRATSEVEAYTLTTKRTRRKTSNARTRSRRKRKKARRLSTWSL